MEFSLIRAPDAMSVGDALREVEVRGIVESDFILVSGDTVSNMDLGEAFRRHEAARAADRSALMTLVFKAAPPGHRTHSLEDDLTVVLDHGSGRLVHFDNDVEERSVSVPVSLLTGGAGGATSLDFRHDLLDARIDICSVEVLHLLADNFDWQDLRAHLLHDVLTSDILGHTVHTHIVERAYAARVKDLRTYDSVARDIIHRWTYPLVPDTNWWGDVGSSRFRLVRNHVYKEGQVSLAWTTEVREDTVLGGGTSVGEGTILEHCVVGRNCRIGANCRLIGAYLWDDVVVEDGVTIDHSLVCAGVRVAAGVSVAAGCILSFGLNVEAGVAIGPDTKLTLVSLAALNDEEIEEWPQQSNGDLGVRTIYEYTDPETDAHTNRFLDAASASTGGRRYAADAPVTSLAGSASTSTSARGLFDSLLDTTQYRTSDSMLREHFDKAKQGYGVHRLPGYDSDEAEEEGASGSEGDSTLSEEVQSSHDELSQSGGLFRSARIGESGELLGLGDGEIDEPLADFRREVSLTLHRAVAEDVPLDNVDLEIKGMRLSANAAPLDCARAMLPALLHMAQEEAGPLTDGRKQASRLLKRFRSLLQQYVGSTHGDQVDIVYELQQAAEEEPALEPLFAHTLAYLYKIDVVEEGAILTWEREAHESGDTQWLDLAEQFLTWLHEAEEESE
jgi:translation initiation factor eIF-2B subunit epsilon